LLNPFVSQRLIMVMNKEHHSGLERLAALAEDGTLASFLDRPFPLRDAADAVGHFDAGRAVGRVVITV
jgi:NADPH:quinone reductase-like Zn-dependent oxidoreductase